MRDDRCRQALPLPPGSTDFGRSARLPTPARTRIGRPRAGRAALALLLAALLAPLPLAALAPAAAQNAGTQIGKESGLPMPRFLSLKADKVNVRAGPSKDHEVVWVFTRAGLPVEVTAEFENWRRIRDSEGAEGWVYHAMLSGRRTALVGSWLKKDGPVALYARRSDDSDVKARLESGVLGNIKDCDGQWCRFFSDNFDGFIQQEKLWGVYPGEKAD